MQVLFETYMIIRQEEIAIYITRRKNGKDQNYKEK